MSESKFRLLAKCLTAILIPCLLAATVYYGSFVNLNLTPKPAFAFSWIQGKTDADIANTTFRSYNLGLALVLRNGTEVHINDIHWAVRNSPIIPPNSPEFNGTIESLVDSISMIEEPNYEISYGTPLSGAWGIMPIYNLTYTTNIPLENTTLSTVLVTSTKTLDMGSYTIHYGPGKEGGFDASSTPGYWTNASQIVTNTPSWTISSTELSEFLKGSGNATIEFHAAFSAHVVYSITYSDNTTITGEKDVAWNGIEGTIGIQYNETGVFELRYEWTRILLALLPLNNP